MKYIEYGKENKDVIMMLHGGGLSWWNYRDEAELLKNRYHVILPIIDGHADSGDKFGSIEAAAKKLVEYIDSNYNGKIKALCGLSLGAQIAVEMLSQSNDICEYAIIESVSLIPSKFTEKLIKPVFSMSYGLIRQEWFSKIQFKALHIKAALYEDYYRDSCLITKEDMISFLQVNSRFSLCDSIKNTSAFVKVVVGSKEQPNMIKSARLLCEAIKGAKLNIKPGLYHGEYSLNLPEEYVNELKAFIE